MFDFDVHEQFLCFKIILMLQNILSKPQPQHNLKSTLTVVGLNTIVTLHHHPTTTQPPQAPGNLYQGWGNNKQGTDSALLKET